MRLPEQAIHEYQEIYKKHFNRDISLEEAQEQGEQLISLFQLLINPIENDWLTNNAKCITNPSK